MANKVAGGVVVVVIFLIWIARMLTAGDLPGCDSSGAKSGLSDIFQSKNVEATKYNEIKSKSESKAENLCYASLTLKDGSVLEIDYKLYFEDKSPKVLITAARDAPKP